MARKKSTTAANGKPSAKPPKSNAELAAINLRRARRLLHGTDGKPNSQTDHLIAEARILAILDLADASRTAAGQD